MVNCDRHFLKRGLFVSDARFDVAVLGAGVVGLAVARRAARAGAKVVVFDPREPSGAGSRAAAGVAIASVRLLDDLPMLEFTRGAAKAMADDLASLPEAAQLRRGGGILRVAADEKTKAALEARSANAPGWLGRWIPGADLPGLEPALEGTPLYGAFLSEEGFMVDTDAYVNALLADAQRAGAQLHMGEAGRHVRETDGAVELTTERGTFRADQLVVCAGAWSGTLAGLNPLPIRPMRGQMMTVHPPALRLTRVVSGPMYLAPWRSGGVVVGATEEDVGFAENVTATGLLQLSAAVAKMAPALREARYGGSWAGLRSSTPSGRPMIGKWPGTARVWVASGHGGQGILTSAATGGAVAKLLKGERAPEVEAFIPG